LTDPATLLELAEVSKSFGRLEAVHGFSLRVSEGEVVGIAGPNGAGKSTLFNIISGAPYAPDSGTIFFRGRRIDRASPRTICRQGLLRTFQTESVFGTLTVWDNMLLAAECMLPDRRRSVRRRAVERVLREVDLFDQRCRVADQLSLSAKKRLMIATALVSAPKLLLLDEPASGLSPTEQMALAELIRRVRQEVSSIVIIEHVLPLLVGLVDRLVIMVEGRSVVEGDPATVVRDPRVVDAYVGRELTA
jgi:ABC-type branched-subunit amino acid transport system ATPase component